MLAATEAEVAATPDSLTNEVPLLGGRDTRGVVRIGDTVRRPSKPSSSFVSRLLGHLEMCGYTAAPRYFGRDECGRETFSYVAGFVPEKFRRFADAQVAEAAGLLRAFHDATRDSELADECPVVCHHDPGPNNTVFRNGRPIAFIDFDYAAPGDPLEDLGYMAWSWCVSSKPDRAPVTAQAAQVRVLVDAYGLDVTERRAVVDAMLARQSRNIRLWSGRVDGFDGPPTSRDQIEERVRWSERELAFTERNRDVFWAALR